MLAASTHVTEIVGYAAAGFVVLYLSTRTVFTVDAATFGVSAVTLLAMTLNRSGEREARARRNDGAAVRLPGFWAEIREGVSYLTHHAGLRANTLLAVAAVAGVGAFYPLTFLLAAERFHGPGTFGLMEAAIAVGYVAGSVVVGTSAKHAAQGSSDHRSG